MTAALYDHFAALAQARPDAPALVSDDSALSRREWLDLVDRTVQQFLADGLGAGQRIGWLGHNRPEMLAALLACAKLGAVWVPLNWRLSPVELAAQARHAGLAALKATPELAGLAARVLVLAPCTGPGPGDDPSHPGDVMLVYTSGSTAAPKAVVHTQAGMLANLGMATAVQDLVATDRVLAVLPLFHVGGLCIQVLPALAAGAVVRLHARFEPGAWLRDVAGWRPSTSLVVPAVMRALIDHPDWAAADLSALRFVNSGSSIVPRDLILAFHARGVPVAQVYGSTETGPVSLALHPAQALAQVGSVGQPAPGVRLRLQPLAGSLADTSGTVVGEIQLQAPNLMRGYHRLPARTGWVGGGVDGGGEGGGDGDADRWFATGDLARMAPDGFVTVVGRLHELIISGGENILPAEIETLASAWPGVAEAVVLGLPDPRWGEVPALVLVALPGVAIDLAGLRAHLALHLARFKQPREIGLALSLPRTALGKVQKGLLRYQMGWGEPD